MGLKSFVRRLLGKRPPSEEDISNKIIARIRNGGGAVGENVHILSSGIDLGEPYLISIGDNVTITGTRLLTHDASTFKAIGHTKVGKVSIGSDVFIGYGTVILPNVSIGNKVIVGAGTIVAKDIPDNSVVVGNPCKIICTYDDYIEKNRIAMKSKPVIELSPDDIMNDEESKNKLIEYGSGYIL